MSGPNFCSDAGANDTYACSLSPAIASLATGTLYWFKANTANSAASGVSTINLNAKGAKTITKMVGGITTNLAVNDIAAGQWVAVIYDGTNMEMASQLGTAVDLASTQSLTNKTLDGVTPTVMGYVDLTSSAQTQLTAKAPIAGPTFTGVVTIPNGGVLGTPTSINLANATFPTLNQNTTGTAANLSGTPALPNGATATTQTTGDNTTKLATDAFVLANAGSGVGISLATLTNSQLLTMAN
jgi:hypothetical protein